jgi:tetratricopeptide (TPR) repeat protein
MLMFWPLALWLTGDGERTAFRRMLAVILALLLAGMTFLRADLWGDSQQQALVWAEKNPRSPRAQAYAAAAERARGRPDLAAERTRKARVAESEAIQVALNLVGAQCELGRVDEEALAQATDAVRASRTAGRLFYTWIEEAIQRVSNGDACQGLGAAEITTLLDAMAQNPNIRKPGWRQDNFGLRGNLALAMHDPNSALDFYNRALDASPSGTVALAQAAQLGSAGHPSEALAHLDHYESLPKRTPHRNWSMASVHAWLLENQQFDKSEIEHLRRVLQEDLQEKSKRQAPAPDASSGGAQDS